MKTFKLNDRIEIRCDWKNTRNGFKHEAKLYIDGWFREQVKICYLNRAWESYEYETVIEKLLECTNLITEEKKAEFLDYASGKSKKETSDMFKSIAMIAQLGELFGDNQKEKNDWKERMLKAGLSNQGLIMPDDWNTLNETEKETRLNAVISELSK